MEKISVKKDLYKLSYEFLNFMEFYGFYFNFSGIFLDLINFKKAKRVYLIARDSRSRCGTKQTHGTATRAHVDACMAPTWREE